MSKSHRSGCAAHPELADEGDIVLLAAGVEILDLRLLEEVGVDADAAGTVEPLACGAVAARARWTSATTGAEQSAALGMPLLQRRGTTRGKRRGMRTHGDRRR